MNGLGGEARAGGPGGPLLVAGDLAGPHGRGGDVGPAGRRQNQKGVAPGRLGRGDDGNIALLGNATDQRAREGRADGSVLATVAGSGAVTDGKGRRERGGRGEHQQHPVEAGIRQAIELLYRQARRVAVQRWRWASPARWA